MTSIIKVDQIQNAAGTVVFDNQLSIDLWRLTANFTSNNATITGWERPDDGYSSHINGLTESSGVFTFTKTGLYKIDFFANTQNGTSADYSMGTSGHVSTDGGSSFDMAAICYSGDVDQGTNNGAAFTFYLNVTNTSLFKVRFETSSLNSGGFVAGNTDYNYTAVSFLKVAPAQ